METARASRPARRAVLAALALAVLALVAAGCGALGYSGSGGDKQKGKDLFVKGANGKPACGSCHVLADAGTTGTIGPSLDAAFAQALKAGMTVGTIRQVVRGQIAYAVDQTSSGSPGMPKNLVTGDDAQDVAAYVADAVAKSYAATGGATAPAPAATTPTPPSEPRTTPEQPAPAPSSGSGTQLAAGKKVFDANGCGSCHTLKDAGAAGTVGPDLDKVAADATKDGKDLAAYVHESIVDPDAYVASGFPKGVMPPDFEKTLSAKQLSDLVAYIVAVAGK